MVRWAEFHVVSIEVKIRTDLFAKSAEKKMFQAFLCRGLKNIFWISHAHFNLLLRMEKSIELHLNTNQNGE